MNRSTFYLSVGQAIVIGARGGQAERTERLAMNYEERFAFDNMVDAGDKALDDDLQQAIDLATQRVKTLHLKAADIAETADYLDEVLKVGLKMDELLKGL